MNTFLEKINTLLIDYAPKVMMAIAILIVGLFLIRIVLNIVKKIMNKRGVEETLQKFLTNLLGWTLKILLFVAVAAKLGIETTSFAAIIGAAGLAIGLALQGSLSNFAGGALIMIFKPFKIGDVIEAQGITGKVKEIQIFTTHLNTPNNRLVIIPNGSLSNGNITNFTAEGKLRVDLTFGVGYDSDIKETKNVFLDVLSKNPKILKDPAPMIKLNELADSSINFIVRPWVKTEDYWDVYFDTIEQTKEALDIAGIEIPYPHAVEIQKES
ncbi:mechanosensitive ion channel family protein [Urechidicola croceus]|uniref:Mechanosensitive ion channel protein n=1 Tax=Urechidicola croceus TaxID=1850246 RepID=A0A1D8P8G7_9FLAO|nr:mechanosensitive ion channel domain-containing protein [Urechidicola croceus]AOW20841.1 mechanosensitive ion channel protein [Urechidicola croceus]